MILYWNFVTRNVLRVCTQKTSCHLMGIWCLFISCFHPTMNVKMTVSCNAGTSAGGLQLTCDSLNAPLTPGDTRTKLPPHKPFRVWFLSPYCLTLQSIWSPSLRQLDAKTTDGHGTVATKNFSNQRPWNSTNILPRGILLISKLCVPYPFSVKLNLTANLPEIQHLIFLTINNLSKTEENCTHNANRRASPLSPSSGSIPCYCGAPHVP
jgi:hypothetical protein